MDYGNQRDRDLVGPEDDPEIGDRRFVPIRQADAGVS